LLIAKTHGGCHHFAVLEEVTHHVSRGTVQLWSELLS
jgi:hypothetical protein